MNRSLFTDLGNADQWIGAVSGKSGVTVNGTPSAGAVAVWDSPGVGHVAWVESVSGGAVTVCRTTGVPPVSSQAVYCTTFNGTSWATHNSPTGIDWGYDN